MATTTYYNYDYYGDTAEIVVTETMLQLITAAIDEVVTAAKVYAKEKAAKHAILMTAAIDSVLKNINDDNGNHIVQEERVKKAALEFNIATALVLEREAESEVLQMEANRAADIAADVRDNLEQALLELNIAETEEAETEFAVIHSKAEVAIAELKAKNAEEAYAEADARYKLALERFNSGEEEENIDTKEEIVEKKIKKKKETEDEETEDEDTEDEDTEDEETDEETDEEEITEEETTDEDTNEDEEFEQELEQELEQERKKQKKIEAEIEEEELEKKEDDMEELNKSDIAQAAINNFSSKKKAIEDAEFDAVEAELEALTAEAEAAYVEELEMAKISKKKNFKNPSSITVTSYASAGGCITAPVLCNLNVSGAININN